MQKISPEEAQAKLAQNPADICFIDVRSTDEFLSGHIPNAICMPLDQIERGQVQVPKDKVVILSCQSGTRSAKALGILRQSGYQNIIELEGGFNAWSRAGFPIHKIRKSIPIIRQVLFTAGSFVLLGSLLSVYASPGFIAIPIFFGAGLSFAGLTGWCGMAFLLEKMPWNRQTLDPNIKLS